MLNDVKDVSDVARNFGKDAALKALKNPKPIPAMSEASVNGNEAKINDGEEPVNWSEALELSVVSSMELASLDLPTRHCLVGEWLKEGDLGFIFAERGVGKSWFGIGIAKAISVGPTFGPWPVNEPRKVLYIDGEMPPDDVKNRDRVLGECCENLVYLNHEILFHRSGRVLNLGNIELQQSLLDLCLKRGTKVLLLDNLSTLVSGVKENAGEDWELIQPWLLQLRRHRITVIFIHHAGRNNQMRGHSKREDPAFWIIRLDKVVEVNANAGARFVARFTKCRNGASAPEPQEFEFAPDGNGLRVTYKEASLLSVFVQHVQDGIDRGVDMADELGISKGYVSKLAKRAEKMGLIKINGTKFVPVGGDE